MHDFCNEGQVLLAYVFFIMKYRATPQHYHNQKDPEPIFIIDIRSPTILGYHHHTLPNFPNTPSTQHYSNTHETYLQQHKIRSITGTTKAPTAIP